MTHDLTWASVLLRLFLLAAFACLYFGTRRRRGARRLRKWPRSQHPSFFWRDER